MSAIPVPQEPPTRMTFGHWRVVQGAPRDDPRSAATWEAEWVLKRNCSVSPAQLLAFYVSLCAVSLGIATCFWLNGATLVMPFAWVELVGVAVALLVYARHAPDRERIALRSGRLEVECRSGASVERAEFAADRVRVEPSHDDRSLIELSGQGRTITVGRHVRPELRRQLAEEFRTALRWSPAGARMASA